jgi:hypothetical protein
MAIRIRVETIFRLTAWLQTSGCRTHGSNQGHYFRLPSQGYKFLRIFNTSAIKNFAARKRPPVKSPMQAQPLRAAPGI